MRLSKRWMTFRRDAFCWALVARCMSTRTACGMSLMVWMLCVAANAGAQQRASVHGDRRAAPDSTNAVPHYPEMLKRAGVVGQVQAQLMVDSTGTLRRAHSRLCSATTPNLKSR